MEHREHADEVNSEYCDGVHLDDLERFAALVADAEAKRMHSEGMVTVGHMRQQIAAEREACAKVCDEYSVTENIGEFDRGWISCAKNMVATIRARTKGETNT